MGDDFTVHLPQALPETWLVHFEYDRPPGELPDPVRLTAREVRSGRLLQLGRVELRRPQPPYPLGPESLFVGYDVTGPLGCHLALGWPMPARVLDLHAEFRCLTAGLELPGDFGVADALAHFGLGGGEGVDALARLLPAMLPQISLGHALLRGRYAAAVARMEAVGVPLDVKALARLREHWGRIQDVLIAEVDRDYGVFDGRKFNPRKWAAWANGTGIRWPKHGPGRLDFRLDAFRDMAEQYPSVLRMKALRSTLAVMKASGVPVGRDGRNRCPLRPFVAKTGRNAPSTTQFIFGPARWLRGLIKPAEGAALTYVDYEQQEFGVAAALSGDAAMRQAYESGDPYLEFAKQAKAVPADATKQSHSDQRDRFKHCALGVQYGMREWSLAIRLGGAPLGQPRELLSLHRRTYPRYWRWSGEVERRAFADGRLQAAYGWTLHVVPGANKRSIRNFPLQANGAEMLRLACCALTEAGVRVCAPVHDALLVEAPDGDIEQAVADCRRAMEKASECVLMGFKLRTETKLVRAPGRYMDARGRSMWEKVSGLLDRAVVARRGEGVWRRGDEASCGRHIPLL
jgi:hypothetical protein